MKKQKLKKTNQINGHPITAKCQFKNGTLLWTKDGVYWDGPDHKMPLLIRQMYAREQARDVLEARKK